MDIFLNDASFKELFNNQLMVQDLLEICAPPGCIENLDFKTLSLCPNELISENLQALRGDTIWRVKMKNSEWLYTFLLLEYQSAIDRFMPVRVLSYASLLWLSLTKNDEITKKYGLPPIFPIVLYNGKRPWNAHCDIKSLLSNVPDDLLIFQPTMKYFLIDINQLSEETLLAGDNTLTAIFFQLERATRNKEEFKKVFNKIKTLPSYYENSITAVYKYYANQSPGKIPVTPEEFAKLSRFRKVSMFDELVDNIQEEGRQEGRQEGIIQGTIQTSRNILNLLLQSRFGDLPESIKVKVFAISDAKLLSDLVLSASSVGSLHDFVDILNQSKI